MTTATRSAYVRSNGGSIRHVRHVCHGNGFCSTGHVDLPSGRVESEQRPWRQHGDDITDLVDDIEAGPARWLGHAPARVVMADRRNCPCRCHRNIRGDRLEPRPDCDTCCTTWPHQPPPPKETR